jgi:1,4-alpha-glucan branching enzyme
MTRATAAEWQADDAAIGAIVGARASDPFAVLGAHRHGGGTVIRALVPGAALLSAHAPDGSLIAVLSRRHEAGFFEGFCEGAAALDGYRLHAENAGASWTLDDPYRFAASLGALDDYLLVEGTHHRLWERLGAHCCDHQHTRGVRFAVWAPNAQRVSVVGAFNDWDGRRAQMRRRVDSGIWEIFIPTLGEGDCYKYEIIGPDGRLLPLKSDPFAFAAEMRPATASVIYDLAQLRWSDAAYLRARGEVAAHERPIAIYEVHLGSWQRGEDGGFLDYDRLADRLLPYVAALGFTHIELLPITEHPLDESWGYQPIGLFAPTRRFGDPAGFARFVDRAHGHGLGVILDWPAAHFPTDAHGLYRFDGTALYEHADPSRGFHPDWNSAIFDFGRPEVANFLLASALFWLEVYHLDGLRVDAVSSMLYLDYSRKHGEWTPNRRGGRENLEAEGFLKSLNALAYGANPGVLMFAEESTTWPGVCKPASAGGLGFGFKWNMGWMNDTLTYLSRDPIHRAHHHRDITFGLTYAFTENFVLPLSHDEVVHGKGSMLARMPGDIWQKFAGLRAYYGFMWGYPGKKLLFMGGEFGQWHEWDEARGLDWALLDVPLHQGVRQVVTDLNALYRAEPALAARDADPGGFRWVVVDDRLQSIFAWLRLGEAADPPILIVVNFTGVPRMQYRLGVPRAGLWREIFNSDSAYYGGSGVGNLGAILAVEGGAQGFAAHADLVIPPLATVYFRYEPPQSDG